MAGFWELLIILGLAMLLFGNKSAKSKKPGAGRQNIFGIFSRTANEFKLGLLGSAKVNKRPEQAPPPKSNFCAENVVRIEKVEALVCLPRQEEGSQPANTETSNTTNVTEPTKGIP